MKTPSRRWLGAALLVGAALAVTGCSTASLGFLLMMGQDPKVTPDCPLAERGKEVKVVVIADAGSNYSPELGEIDRLLSAKLVEILRERFKVNKEKVEVVPTFKVDAFRQRQLDWRSLSAQEIGKHFGADYVINLDIAKVSLYEEKSQQTLYRGRAEIAVKVINVKAPEGEGEKFSRDYVCPEYPKAYPVEATISVGIFRTQFVSYVAEELSRYFAAFPAERRYDMH